MIYSQQTFPQYAVEAQIASYSHSGSICEFHVMFHTANKSLPYTSQLSHIIGAYKQFLSGSNKYHPVMLRFFVTDAANQVPDLLEQLRDLTESAISIVEQPLLSGGKIGLWAYIIEGDAVEVNTTKGMHCLRHGNYEHYWTAGRKQSHGDSAEQTRQLFEDYESDLQQLGCNIADNCIRTWLFVRDVDVNYAGVVKARRDNFTAQGLTKDTHYIASTGIEGCDADPNALVLFDAYSVKGVRKEQIQFLYAPTHLSPTHVYGVTFERGVSVSYGDRRHVFISGTASIDNKGDVMYPCDIRKQTDRMCENVEKLLEEAGASAGNMAHILVYLRDLSDYPLVNEMIDDRYPNIPRQFLLAPVCRPAWLIEMECVAVVYNNDSRFECF